MRVGREIPGTETFADPRNSAADAVFGYSMSLKNNRLTAAGAVAVLLALTVTLLADAGAGSAQTARSVVLGKTPVYPDSGCPAPDHCEVIARVTGIQMKAEGVDHPFRAPMDGRLVSWWLRLPRLHSTQMQSFNSLFGGDPAARITVLRRSKAGRFRLVRQGPTQLVKDDLDGKGRARYRLAEPLRVKQGDYVGLTAVTWLPAFAVNLDAAQNYWLASRPKDRCNTPPASRPKRFAAYYRRTEAHLRASTVKLYQCIYQTARLLYWARIEPEPVEPGPGPSPPNP
jgi:hypothetical protein